MGMNVDNRIPDGNDHLTIQSITAWISGECTANLQLEYEQHCVRCAECREQMVMISQSMQPDDELAQSAEFQEMLRIGEQAAMRAWEDQQKSVAPEPEPEQKPHPPKPEPWFKRLIPVRQPSPRHAEVLVSSGQVALPLQIWQQPVLRFATVALLLMAASIPGYLYWQSNQPVNRGMASLRQAWDRNRPIETRVTGDFPYLPYMVTRGPGDTVPVNDAQLLAATADLAREVADHPSPRAKHALGRLHLLKEEFDRAEPLLKEVIAAEPQNAQAHVDLASVYYERGVRDESLQLLAKAADHLKTATEASPILAEAWFNLALCHEQMKQDLQAIADWERFLELDSVSKWADEARERLQRLRKQVQLFTPESSKAADDLLAAEAAGDEARIRQLLTEKFSEVSSIAWGRLLDEYLTATGGGDQLEAAKYLRLLQRLAALIRDDKKDHYFTDQLDFITHSNPIRLQKICLIRDLLARAEQRYQAADYKRAVALFSQAQSGAEQIGDQCHVESAMYGIAKVYTPQTESAASSMLRKQLVSIADKHRHRQMQAQALAILANQYGSQQLVSSSLATLSAASEIAQSIGDSDCAIYSLRNMVTVYSYAGQSEAAYKNGYSIIQLLRKSGANLRNSCAGFGCVADIFADKGDYRQAIGYQREALRFCERGDEGAYLYHLGRAAHYYSQSNQQDRAAELLNQAASAASTYISQTGMQSLLFALHMYEGEVALRQEKGAQAEAAFRQAKSVITEPSHVRFLARISHGMARAYLQQGRFVEAETELASSIALDDQVLANIHEVGGQSGFLESRLNIYRTMVDFQFFHKQTPARAFDYGEQSRSRELLDVLAGSDASGRIMNGVRRVAQSVTLDQVQQAMPAESQLLAYTVTERQLLIWLVTSTDWRVAGVPITSARLQTMTADFLNELRNTDDAQAITPLARELYSLLIEPLADHLSRQRTLVIVPDSVLHAVPFAALLSPTSSRYLVEDYAICSSPSVSVFLELIRMGQKKPPSGEGSLLVISNPKFDRQIYPNLPWLPATEQEAADLKSLYPISLQFSRAKATKQALLSEIGNYEIVHLSAHSLTNERNPLYSAIVLASAERPASQTAAEPTAFARDALQAREVFGLTLSRTRLVILSSCRSSTREQLSRNSFGTLAHAFFSARVPAVVNSLWEVDDNSTARLMLAFHRANRSEGNNFSQALRQAQLSLLRSENEKWRHPYFWAAFLVSGNGLMD